MKFYLIGGAALLAFAPAIAQVAPAPKAPAVHTRAEVEAKVAEHFARLDTNRDGFVTRAEADAARAQFRERIVERVSERRADAFDRLDANKDGAISREEWNARPTQRAERARTTGDRRAMHRGMRGMHMGVLSGRMLEMADADKDGRVSLQEAQAAALRHFDMADSNRDGQITPDERRQMHQRMISERRPG